MTDDEVLEAVEELVGDNRDRAVTVGDVVDCVATRDVDEVALHLEQLREGGRLYRAVGSEEDQPPAVVSYTLYEE